MRPLREAGEYVIRFEYGAVFFSASMRPLREAGEYDYIGHDPKALVQLQ